MRVWLSRSRGNQTQQQIAEQAGITQSYYSMIESGQRTPQVALAKRLGEIMDFDWQKFYDDEGNKTA